MSNPLAIAAVTEVLLDLVAKGVQDEAGSINITALPPDKVQEGSEQLGLNLFLYQSVFSSAWRNQDLSARNGMGGQPSPLPLHLNYLLTAYGNSESNSGRFGVMGHRLLGKAMRILHDYSILDPVYIRRVLQGYTDDAGNPVSGRLPESDLHQQVDRVRINPLSLSVDELSKLWTTFQTQYRISAAYEVSVVLIESAQAKRMAMPVLSRGQPLAANKVSVANNRWDQGILVQPSLLPAFPTLFSLALPSRFQPSLQLGQTLRLEGAHLEGTAISVLFRQSKLDVVREIIVPQSQFAAADVTIPELSNPDQATEWPAGFHQVSVRVGQGADPQQARTSNELALAIAPTIVPNSLSVSVNNNGLTPKTVFTVRCRPLVWPSQQAELILSFEGGDVALSDRVISAVPRASDSLPTDTLTFEAQAVPVGNYRVRPRLRVDGIDSFIITYPNTRDVTGPALQAQPAPALIPYVPLEVLA